MLCSGLLFQCSATYQSKAVTIQSGLENDARLSTFLSLVETVGGMNVLLSGSNQNHTYFVPTNAAFDQLGQRLLDNLSMRENRDVLLGVLQSHVTRGSVRASDAGQKEKITSIFDTPIDLAANSAEILYSIKTRQGLIHVVDKVIQR